MRVNYPEFEITEHGKYKVCIYVRGIGAVYVKLCDNKMDANLAYLQVANEWYGVGMWGWVNAKHILYSTWKAMHERCYKKGNHNYNRYGGRGITVCTAWSQGDHNAYKGLAFKRFVKDMGVKPTREHTLDRINNNEGYSKCNCRWATKVDQARNRGLSKYNITGYKGVARYNKGNNKYRVTITVNYKQIALGVYKTLDEAIEARRLGEIKYW